MNKVNISIDDISPHPLSGVGVLGRCNELIEVFPDIKFSLFVPVAYWRTQKENNKPDTTSQKPYDLREHPEFCEALKKLPKENYELCYHGLFHGIPGLSNNDEFKDLSLYKAKFKARQMKDIGKAINVEFSPVFRPPAWRMAPDSFVALLGEGIEMFALSPEKYAMDTYGEIVKELNCIYYNVNPPFKPLRLFEKTEIVYHACEWDQNYLDVKKTNELIDFIGKNKKHIEFTFIRGLL